MKDIKELTDQLIAGHRKINTVNETIQYCEIEFKKLSGDSTTILPESGNIKSPITIADAAGFLNNLYALAQNETIAVELELINQLMAMKDAGASNSFQYKLYYKPFNALTMVHGIIYYIIENNGLFYVVLGNKNKNIRRTILYINSNIDTAINAFLVEIKKAYDVRQEIDKNENADGKIEIEYERLPDFDKVKAVLLK